MTPHELIMKQIWMGSRIATERASTLRLFTENFDDRVLARSINRCVDCYIDGRSLIFPVVFDLQKQL